MYLAIGIIGDTVMPHNLYMHTSIVQTRRIGKDLESKQDAVKMERIDTIGSLAMALLVNAAILELAAAALYKTGHTDVVEIQDAYHLLDPLVGRCFRQHPVRYRPAGIGPELDLHRHHCRAT